jgi:hypothetical protein
MLILGPWEGVIPREADRVLGRQELGGLTGGVLENGIIAPLWKSSSSDLSGRTVLGAFNYALTTNLQHILFYRDETTGTLWVEQNLLYEKRNINTGITTLTDQRVVSVAYGKYVYFSSRATLRVQRLDTETGEITALTNSPGRANYLGILNDHLFAAVVDVENLFYILHWSVNADFTDWLGAGSGNKILAGIGDIRGIVQRHDLLLITGTEGSTEVYGTGTLPSFRFRDNPFSCTSPHRYTVVEVEGVIFFGDYEGDLKALVGGETVNLNRMVSGVTSLWPSKNLGGVFAVTKNATYLVDAKTLRVVHEEAEAWDAIADAGREDVLFYKSEDVVTKKDLKNGPFNAPSFQTGWVDFGEDTWLEYIDTDVDLSTPLFSYTIEFRTQQGHENIKTLRPVDGRLLLSQTARWIRISGIGDPAGWTNRKHGLRGLALSFARISGRNQ